MAQEMQVQSAAQARQIAPLMDFSARQVALIHRTVCKDATPDELNFFIELCRHRGLDPFRRQVYAVIYNKTDAARRQLVIIVGLDGQRALAERCGNYLPDPDPPEYELDESEVSPVNPLGLVLARVRPRKFSHGAWHPIAGEARWSEFAPIKLEPEGGWDWEDSGEVWADSGKPKKRRIARGKTVPILDDSGLWPKMPRRMLAKCAEMQALRAGWPDEYGGLYAEEEMDRQRSIDVDAADLVEAQAEEDRRDRVKAGGKLAFTFGGSWNLEYIEHGKVADRVIEWLSEKERTADEVGAFVSANRHALKEFWAASPTDALELKKRIETTEQALEQKRREADAKPAKADKRKADQPAQPSEAASEEKSRLV